MTDSAYRKLSEAEQIFKDLVWDPMIRAGEWWIEGEVPLLDAPVIKQADEALINTIFDAIYQGIIKIIDIESIKMTSAARQTAYDASSIRLMVVASDSGIDSEEYRKARDEELVELAKFTHIGPDAPAPVLPPGVQ